jgi:K(+)-stimulated pyrophosphate-energized sodium pump
MLLDPSFVLNLVILCGILSIVFAYVTGVQILSASAGNARMKEIAGAIQIGARAYLNRQYKTIAIVGVLVLIAVIYLFNFWVGLGYFIGAFLSGIAGYAGMLISVQANVRTAEASRKSLAEGLKISFKSGALTGMLVAGLALLAIAVYYLVLIEFQFLQD